jgi:hypothetical protein
MPERVEAVRQAGVVGYPVKPADFGRLWCLLSAQHCAPRGRRPAQPQAANALAMSSLRPLGVSVGA